jgi:hypothetical protein
MPPLLEALRKNTSYFFIAVGVAWLVVAALTGSVLVLWPVVACVAAGVLIRVIPGGRLTWAWTIASAALGLLLAAYEVYAWAPFIGGTFSTLGIEGTVGFGAFTVVHLLLFYSGWGRRKAVGTAPA